MTSSTITRIPAHVKTAASEGMKAGYKQFAAAASKSGLPSVQALWDEFAGLSAKPKFNLYCTTYGPLVDAIQADTPQVPFTRSTPRTGRVKNASAAPIQEVKKMDNVQEIVEAAVKAALEGLGVKVVDAPVKKAAKVVVETPATITPKDPKAPVTYKQAMTLRFSCGLSKAQVAKLNQGQASKKIAAFYAAA